MLKKCITILLIIFLFINSGGFIVIFYQVQNSVKTRVMLSIRNGKFKIDNVTKFKLDKDKLYLNVDGFIWREDNEFEYDGTLYDIIIIEEDKKNVTLFCLNDITESRIIKNFNDEVNDLASGKINNSKYKTSLINLISHALCIYPYKLIQPDKRQEFSFKAFLNIPSPNSEVLLPPPKTT